MARSGDRGMRHARPRVAAIFDCIVSDVDPTATRPVSSRLVPSDSTTPVRLQQDIHLYSAPRSSARALYPPPADPRGEPEQVRVWLPPGANNTCCSCIAVPPPFNDVVETFTLA